uniref:Eukaryotic translation initiation factor 3 subunit A n=1 Tax=Aceria tosichella TaxID=561515 RepID=A0A6G1SGM1_9ACAR
MPSTFLKIENALKRANEFIDVGKRNSALETLCDAIRAKRHRTWQRVHEEIMFKYLELAVDLRKSYIAKEGIFQYKLICQQTNIKSFEDVVRRYIDLAEEKAEWAKNRAASRTTDDVDDLDVVQTPEEILLSAVSSEDQQDRSERVKLIPWVRFLWEAYRQCLDILKNNVRTEALYHEIAHRAFQFCTKFNRKTEFRKLCDNLRTHMDYLRKTQLNAQQQPTHTQSHIVNLNNPESLAMQLETKLIQLESAVQIELWQEAYRATDDIKRYGLMNLNKKPPKPQLMANYYQKLSLVFWKADCHLFHAAALFRLFHLTRELKKTITPEEVQRMASKLVIATLTIPIAPNRPDIDKLVDTEENTVETHQRNLASLLGLTTVLPTRSQLVKDLKRMGYLQHAYQPLQDLYRYLELDFHPLAMCERVQGIIQFIENCEECPDVKNYTETLKSIAIYRLLKGVSQVYQTIQYDRLSELCPFADNTYLETMVVEAARRNDLQVRIDHRRNCLHFGTELCASQSEEVIEGPHLQSMPSEQVRLQLVNTYSTLLKTRTMIEPEAVEQQRERLRIDMMYRYFGRRAAEHAAILSRYNLIEERKKQLEILGVRMEQEERLRQEAKQRKLAEEEHQRMQLEKENRERQMKDRESNEIQSMAAKQRVEAIGLKEDFEQAKKEQKELFQKQRRLERKIDHLERAKRLEEIPLLEKEYEKWRELDRKIWEECENQRIQDFLAERELAKTLSQRLRKLKEDAEQFASKVSDRHQAIYEARLIEFNAKLEQERVKRLEARKIKRREERRNQWLKEKEKAEEDRRRQKEEEKRRIREEEERRREKEEEDRRRAREESEAEKENWRAPSARTFEPPPSRGFEPPPRGLDPLPRGMEPPSRGFDGPAPIRGFGAPVRGIETSTRAMEPPPRGFDRPPREFDRPPRDFDRPPRDFDRPPREFDRPPRDFDRPPRDLDRPPRDLDQPPPARGFGAPSRGMEPPARGFDQPPPARGFGAPVRNLDAPPRSLDPPVRGFDHPPREFDRPPRDFDRPPRDLDQPPIARGFGAPPRGGVEPPLRGVDLPPRGIEPPLRRFDQPPPERGFGPSRQPPLAPPQRPDPDADGDWRQTKEQPKRTQGPGRVAAPEGSWR